MPTSPSARARRVGSACFLELVRVRRRHAAPCPSRQRPADIGVVGRRRVMQGPSRQRTVRVTACRSTLLAVSSGSPRWAAPGSPSCGGAQLCRSRLLRHTASLSLAVLQSSHPPDHAMLRRPVRRPSLCVFDGLPWYPLRTMEHLGSRSGVGLGPCPTGGTGTGRARRADRLSDAVVLANRPIPDRAPRRRLARVELEEGGSGHFRSRYVPGLSAEGAGHWDPPPRKRCRRLSTR